MLSLFCQFATSSTPWLLAMVIFCCDSFSFILYIHYAVNSLNVKVYYREREARRAARQAAQQQQQPSASSASASQPAAPQGPGTQNHGWDDDNFDYIITPNEVIQNRYVLQKRIGKGSFGQVVQALDKKTNKEVAIKIIKSKKPFLMQARTEIELLTLLSNNDAEDQNNIGESHVRFDFPSG